VSYSMCRQKKEENSEEQCSQSPGGERKGDVIASRIEGNCVNDSDPYLFALKRKGEEKRRAQCLVKKRETYGRPFVFRWKKRKNGDLAFKGP